MERASVAWLRQTGETGHLCEGATGRRPMATYEQIQKWVRGKDGWGPQTCWIAHCKELKGSTLEAGAQPCRRSRETVPGGQASSHLRGVQPLWDDLASWSPNPGSVKPLPDGREDASWWDRWSAGVVEPATGAVHRNGLAKGRVVQAGEWAPPRVWTVPTVAA